MTKQNKPALIVFGKKVRKQPRAAWFVAADAAVARWIAQRYGLVIFDVTPKAAQAIGNAIAEWQLTSRGEPMLPTIRPDLFDRLNALASEASAGREPGVDDNEGTEAPPPSPEQVQAARGLWGELVVGSLVIAQEEDPEDGWWEAIILARHKTTCTLCWRDHPEDGLVKRELHQLAYLHPTG